MNNQNISLLKIASVAMLFLCFFISCKKEDNIDPNLLEKPQLIMYTPVSDSSGVTVRFVWNKVKSATNYQLDLSANSLLFAQDLQTYSVNDTNTIIIKGIASNTVFSARLKAYSADKLSASKFHISTLIPRENIFAGMTSNYGVVTYPGTVYDSLITNNTVKLKWRRGKNITGIIKTVNGVTDTLKVTMATPTDTSRIIAGLNAATAYNFKIYYNKMIRGNVNVVTK